MIEPGLYKHYKGNLYRVLFGAEWAYMPSAGLPAPDEELEVWSTSLRRCVARAASNHTGQQMHLPLLTARWSGNDGDIGHGMQIVIYVALYDEGRVSARPLKEFEERLRDVPCSDIRGVTHDLLRFERIGE